MNKILCLVIILSLSIAGYFFYQNQYKKEVLNKNVVGKEIVFSFSEEEKVPPKLSVSGDNDGGVVAFCPFKIEVPNSGH